MILDGADRYIGLNDILPEGTFVWAPRDLPFDPTKFDGRGRVAPAGDCFRMLPSGLWDDQSCSTKENFFCEKPLVRFIRNNILVVD